MQSPKRGVTHHWVGAEPDPDKYYGFLYIITNNVTGKKYIGRKFYHTYRKRKKFKESNWRTYTGSCKPLNEDIKKLGKTNFTFEIFKQYVARGNVVYYECNYQHKFDVLTAKDENGERLWYNGNIGAIKFIPPEENSPETKRKISESTKGDKHHHYDSTVHEWVNTSTGEEVNLTQNELYVTYGLNNRQVSRVARGELTHVKGWCLKGNQDKINHIRNSSYTIYKGNEELTGSLSELSNMLNIPKQQLSRLLRGERKTCHQWRLR